MKRVSTRKVAVIAALVLGAGAVAGGAATIAGDDDADETPITGPALERARAAALAHVGQGVVSGTEDGDEESRYEVEVTRDDGSQVDVQLDEGFAVVGGEEDRGDEED